MGQKNSKPCGKYLRELHRKVPNMNRDDIINAYEDFRKQSGGKDRLTKKDFVKVYKQAFGTNGAQQLAENIFNSFDKDGSGTVDFEEFLVGLSITEGIADFHSDEEYREKILKWSFNVYDKDKNNHIDRDEMRHIVHVSCLTLLSFVSFFIFWKLKKIPVSSLFVP